MASKGNIPWNKGKTRNVTWGPALSAALKGRIIRPGWRANIAAALTGKKRPGVGGRKPGFVAWNKGMRKATHPGQIKYGKCGAEHWAWKGGVSAEIMRFRQTSEYKAWRDGVFGRDWYKCRKCGKGGDIEAHHVVGLAVIWGSQELQHLLLDPKNGVTLCVQCHKEAHREDDNIAA